MGIWRIFIWEFGAFSFGIVFVVWLFGWFSCLVGFAFVSYARQSKQAFSALAYRKRWLSLRDEFGIVRIFRESRCKDTTSQKLILGLGWFRCEKVGKKWFRYVSLGFHVYNIYLYILYLYAD